MNPGSYAKAIRRDAPDCARLYAQLPLDRVTRGELTPDGRTEMVEIGEPSPLMDEVRDLGETFGSFLTSLIESAEPGSSVEPGEIVVGGGPGTATGAVGFEIYDQIYPLAAFVKFTLAPLGGDRRPDDAPRARLDCYATVPGSIFTVFREFFTGDSEGPLEISPARTTVVHQAGQSE